MEAPNNSSYSQGSLLTAAAPPSRPPPYDQDGDRDTTPYRKNTTSRIQEIADEILDNFDMNPSLPTGLHIPAILIPPER